MRSINRRDVLSWMALAPALPSVLLPQLVNAASRPERYDGRVVIVIRMLGGNDGLNTVIPLRDDRYYRARPTIAIAKSEALPLEGGDLGLHPALAEFRSLMDRGLAGVVQAVGYPDSSRSHLRATEIWETASLAATAPTVGWLGRYLDSDPCACEVSGAGVQLGDAAGRTLASARNRTRSVEHPSLLLNVSGQSLRSAASSGPANPRFTSLVSAQNALADAASLLQRAERGTGAQHAYPDTSFGHALRWTGDMIETECAARAFCLSIGSFETGAASFDTHIDELPKHQQLYTELASGLTAFAEHLAATRDFGRVLVLTFSDFGRQLPENTTKGTEHGDASVLFFAGGAVQAGLRGSPPNLADIRNGGVRYRVDFRSIYADVLGRWLGGDAGIFGDEIKPFPVVA